MKDQLKPVAEVSQETFSSDGTSDIITCNLPIGTKLYAFPEGYVVVPAGYTPVKTEAVLFLLGLGAAFTQPEGAGNFWWRQHLHEAIPGGLEAMLEVNKQIQEAKR